MTEEHPSLERRQEGQQQLVAQAELFQSGLLDWLVQDELEVAGRLYPWYLCPIPYDQLVAQAGLFFSLPSGVPAIPRDPFVEQRAQYDKWRDFYRTPKTCRLPTGQTKEWLPKEGHPAYYAETADLFDGLCRANPVFFMHHCIHIIDKDKQEVLFDHHNIGQRLLFAMFALLYYVLHLPVRLILLKARQVGGSTWTEALLLWLDIWFPNQCVTVLADIKEHSANFKEMVDRMVAGLDHSPLQGRVPELRTNTKHELYFGLARQEVKPEGRRRRKKKEEAGGAAARDEQTGPAIPALNSRYKIGTAKTRNEERSSTNSGVHGSEVSKWSNPESCWLGLANTVSDGNLRSIVVLESTANGMEFFHDSWEDAGRDDSPYCRIFVSWLSYPFRYSHAAGGYVREYSEALPARYQSETGRREYFESYNPVEQVLAARGATPEQIQYRRSTLRTKCSNDPRTFQQEYPSTPDEAFLTSGEGVYSTEAVAHYVSQVSRRELNPLVWRGEFTLTEDDRVVWIDRADGPVKMWRRPEPGKTYVLGADPSEGRTAEADHGAGQVLDAATREQVAIYFAIRDIEYMALQVHCLQVVYNANQYGLVVPEANACGGALIIALKNLGTNPMYQRDTADRVDSEIREVYGYYAAGGSKKRMVSNSKAKFNSKNHVFHDYDTVVQFKHLVFRDGKYKSSKKKVGDDLHDAWGIANLGIDSGQIRWREQKIEGMGRARGFLGEVQAPGAKKPEFKRLFLYDGEPERFCHPTLGEDYD